MKICPTCQRNYADETLLYCLEDGAQLTTSRDSQATLVVSPARDTDPPATIVLPPEYFTAQPETVTHAAGRSAPPPPPTQVSLPSAPANATPVYNPSYAPPPSAAKSSRTPLIIVAAVAAMLIIGVVAVAGLILLAPRGPATVNTNANSNNRNVAANNVPAATPTPNSTPADGGAWMAGTWTGNGVEADTSTWTVELTVTGSNYAISYPSLRCTGQWDLIQQTATEARFTEVMDRSDDTDVDSGCASGGEITVRKLGDSQLTVQWTYDDSTGDNATAVLTKAE